MTRIDSIRKLLNRGESKLINYIFHNPDDVTDFGGYAIDPKQVLYNIGVLSSGEQILIKVALDIWGGYGKTSLEDIIWRLDSENFQAVLQALIDTRIGS